MVRWFEMKLRDVEPDIFVNTSSRDRNVVELGFQLGHSPLNVKLLAACEQEVKRTSLAMFLDAIQNEVE